MDANMGQPIETTVHFLQSMCKDPNQRQVLDWMMSQPKDDLLNFLRGAVSNVPREALPNLVQEHLGAQSDDTKNHVLSEITKAYDFLRQGQN